MILFKILFNYFRRLILLVTIKQCPAHARAYACAHPLWATTNHLHTNMLLTTTQSHALDRAGPRKLGLRPFLNRFSLLLYVPMEGEKWRSSKIEKPLKLHNFEQNTGAFGLVL